MNNHALLTHLIAIALGVVATIWLYPDNSNQKVEFEAKLNEKNRIIEQLRESKESLAAEFDSLQDVRNQIEYRYDTLETTHQFRGTLPFAVNDTAARYRFFANRFPYLFTSRSN